MDKDAQPDDVYPIRTSESGMLFAFAVGLALLNVGLWWVSGMSEPLLLLLFVPLAVVLVVVGAGLRWWGRAAYHVTDQALVRVSSFGRRKVIAWSRVQDVWAYGGSATLSSYDGSFDLERGVERSTELLKAVEQRVEAHRPRDFVSPRQTKAGDPFDLSEWIGEGETVVVEDVWTRWQFGAAAAGVAAVAAFYVWVALQGRWLAIFVVLLLAGPRLGNMATRRNRLTYDRQGLRIVTPTRRALLSWADVEGYEDSLKDVAIRTRVGTFRVPYSHSNYERLKPVLQAVAWAHTRGLVLSPDAGAAPTALSRTRLSGDEPPETAVSRVAGEEG